MIWGVQMLIDVHTHIFPDKIAAHAIRSIKDNIQDGSVPVNYTNATAQDLLKAMDRNGVDISFALPVATTVTQYESINRFALLHRGRIMSFAGIHPKQDNLDETLMRIKENDFIGIKLHPEFQHFDIDSRESIHLLQTAENLGLYTTIHAGYDPSITDRAHGTPKQIKNTLDYISGRTLIAAHLGGWKMWDDVEKYLVKSDILFDTAMLSGAIEPEQYKRIIQTHGSYKILFGSDSPWEDQGETLRFLKSLQLSDTEFENITYKNALKFFGEKLPVI